MPDPIPLPIESNGGKSSSSIGWWITTVLGAVAAILVPIVSNCTFGPDICPILVAISSAISAYLGITHAVSGLVPFKKAA